MAKAKLPDDSTRPSRITQVSAYLKAHGITGVSLDRGTGFFYFRAPRTMDWVGNSIVGEKVSELTLGEWLARYREAEKLNSGRVNPFTGERVKPVRRRSES
jgi:hypothetical protein